MATAEERRAATDERIRRWVENAIAELPPLTRAQERAAVAIYAPAIHRRRRKNAA